MLTTTIVITENKTHSVRPYKRNFDSLICTSVHTYMCVCAYVFVYANEMMMFWLMYAVIVVDTLHKKDIIFTDSVVVLCALGQWNFLFGVRTTGFLCHTLVSFGLNWLSLPKHALFYDFFWCYFIFSQMLKFGFIRSV